MPSSGGWTLVPSQPRQESDESGSAVDVFSLISANPESSSLDLDANHSMALPSSNNQPTSEDHLPLGPAIVDWVEEQSLHEKTSNDAIGLQSARVGSVSTHSDAASQARAKTNEYASREEGGQQAKKVYDIPTLLKLRETQSAIPVMLHVKPEAIAENIFQYMGASTSRRLSARSRGLSDISNISTGNAESHNHTIYPAARQKYMAHPIRQPNAPPENSLLQRHDGFVRFLKQHASPPHQRVTAGGRIVPAGPSSPPPMLDFGSLNGFLRERPVTAKAVQKESRSNQCNTRAQKPQATSSISLGDYLRSQSGSADGTTFQHAPQNLPLQAAIPFTTMPLSSQNLMAPMQTPTALIPLAMFPDGSTLVSYNGVNYRASWNGMNAIMEPLQPLQVPIDQHYYSQAYPQGYVNSSQYSTFPQPSLLSVPSVPLASATNVPRPDTTKSDLLLPHEAHNNDEPSLKAKLTNLDEHLALHHYDITPLDRASLIAQRVFLVAELDRIRLSKTKSKHKIPIVAPAAPGAPVTPATQVPSDPQNNRSSKAGTMSKHLSPAAPAFVPRSALEHSSTSFDMRRTGQQSRHQEPGIPASATETDTAFKAKNNAKSSNWANYSDDKAPPPNTARESYNEASSSSSALDSLDPAMRIIEHKDIEYAARYLYNWTKDTKTYCTTVSEFQEAIRRVREQARLYGCAGGQSKDPAYDAEQDLWWAICDRDPIPLPSKIPDHVTKPRPWNWNDSAFNYRHQGANDAPELECEQARNSPRVLGWDPATTDKMKDVMDVSRSYFALKGRLPSVTFRQFAYDRDGNQRLIQSDTAASIAHATAAKTATHAENLPIAGSQWHGPGPVSNSSTLRGMSAGELNMPRIGCEPNAQLKPFGKEKAPEPVHLPPGAPRTPEHRCTQQSLEASNVDPISRQSEPSVSPEHVNIKPKDTEINNGAYYASVEDHPETPVARGIRSASKGALTDVIKSTPLEASTNLLSAGGMIASNKSSVHANVLGCADLSGPSWNPTEEELNGIWYQTPLDEVTQKYVDDMKAYNSLKSKQADGNDHHVHTTEAHHQISSSSEPVAESKSQWGPEEGASLTTPSERNQLESLGRHRKAEDRGMIRAAKVKIPMASPIRTPIPRANGENQLLTGFKVQDTLDSRELNAINIPSIENNDSHSFLRKMLKSPRYSSAQPTSIFSQISSALTDKFNGTKRAQTNLSTQQVENRLNTILHKHGNTGSIDNRSYAENRPSSSTSSARAASNIAVSKAQSSLASSTYQAHAHLPQYEGAGKARTSSVYREQGNQPLPHVRLPSEDSYIDREYTSKASYIPTQGPSASTASTTYHNPVNFGYDGGRDSPPPKATANSKDQQSTNTEFDLMGVTLADYEHQRGDTNNAWHHGAVDDFFQDLREQELETIASHQRVNTQSAA